MTVTKHRTAATGMMLVSISLAAAQTGERGIVPEDVIQARPAASAAVPVKAKPQYAPLDPQMVATLRRSPAASEIGVTIWRLRPAAAADDPAPGSWFRRQARPPSGPLCACRPQPALMPVIACA